MQSRDPKRKIDEQAQQCVLAYRYLCEDVSALQDVYAGSVAVPHEWDGASYLMSNFIADGYGSFRKLLRNLAEFGPSDAIMSAGVEIAGIYNRLVQILKGMLASLKGVKWGKVVVIGKVLSEITMKEPWLRQRRARVLRRFTERELRFIVIDRVCDRVESVFRYFRDLLRLVESKFVRENPPIRLGAHAASFVEIADRKRNLLMLRLPNGGYDSINVSVPWIWDELLRPLLESTDQDGVVDVIDKTFRSRLSRETDRSTSGDMARLSSYIHSTGIGRGGRGGYFLSPEPRQVSTWDR